MKTYTIRADIADWLGGRLETAAKQIRCGEYDRALWHTVEVAGMLARHAETIVEIIRQRYENKESYK